MKKIGIKKIETTIPENAFVSRIEGLSGNVNNVTLDGTFSNMMVYEVDSTMFVLVDFSDCSGTMPALIAGSRDDEFRDFVENIIMKYKYRIRGNVALVKDTDDIDLPFIKKIKGQHVFFITAIDDLKAIKLFDVEIAKLYDYDLNKAYNFVVNNTDYLNGISLDDVNEISFSCYKDIIILLKNGVVLLNGKEELNNIKSLGFMSGLSIFAFSYDNVITCLTGDCDSLKFMNNNDYKYKKIIVTPLVIVALTFEKDIRLFGTLVDQVVDYHRFIDVEDIGYVDAYDDIVVIKDGEAFSLFYEHDYTNEIPHVIVEGSIGDIVISNE